MASSTTIPSTMKAMVSKPNGGYQLANDVPQPTLQPDAMLIRVHAVSLNPYDAKIVEFGMSDPGAYVGGCDSAGVPCRLDGMYGRPATPEHRRFAARLFVLAERWLREGRVRNHPLEIREGGLESVDAGLADLRAGMIRGKKIVVPLEVGA
ncbi:hypothetical protein MAPG_10187 [Magnaporthiopsis poae ATCC 64411]|uniref:Uncharacterized protein n=1 Tax=Magnaporthiopsis poae (strain ATCC 64411 / 73-15) TaxID=644358 RepID=A0A0C4EBX5_MAGP6|nr:hypothetical protein MAPG_10187 [Magnaporthiopsis poae ATCC 64411]